VTVIPNGVSADTFAPIERGEARRLLGLHPTDRLIVSVGHLSPRKGFHRVIAIMPELIKSMPDLRFAIVGGAGAERNNAAELRAQVRDRGLSDRVVFAGAQPPAMVARWLSAADVFVLASDFEGCPNVVWEALASGRPVVATRVGEVDRMVPSFAGVLFDRADDAEALRASLLQAFETAWDASAIRAYAALHTWSDVADQVLAEWRKALDATDSTAAPRPDVGLKPARTDYQNEVE
jgi:glycosyltransferase involved in cell wall biosynthesis